ncbi:MAG: chromosome segregation protein SMC [Candidatus Gastranaerophilales bacterium]|nr:chromosome segregation protein SMC [Candidatus Gastranaerophilales bacterium]
MYIKEIEIDNFKSFANKVTIPFMDGFTTISGPNGSGKSNIIDSVLFALGLSSSRTLRAEKLFHLISTHNNKNEAAVKITFAPAGEDEPIVVTRKIKKAGAGNFISSYALNGKGSTLSEIHDYLAKYNISPNSYNVIMQGDVTGITNTTPNERRKIIDEIAGVADFDRKIEQATRELEMVETRVEKSTIILNEIDSRMEQLEQERKEALKYKKLKDEKTELESKISVVKYFDIKNSIERLHESILEANKQKKLEQETLKKLSKTLILTQAELDDVAAMVKTKGEAEQIEIKKHSEALKGEIARKKDSIAFCDKQIADNKDAGTSSNDNIANLKQKIDDTLIKIEGKNDEIKIIESNIAKEKAELERVLSQVTDINQSTNEHVERRNDLRRQVEKIRDDENLLIKEKIPMEEKLSSLRKELTDSKDVLAQLEESQKMFDSNEELLKTQIEEIQKELVDFESAQKKTLTELDTIKNQITDSSYNINLAYRKIQNLEAQKQAFEDANFGRAIETVMNSGLGGIHAPLAKLGKVDKKYSLALEVAMGSRMRYIVVDSDEVASVAIEILKSANAGRASFLPLNKIKKAPASLNLPKEQGVVDYAIDLIEYDDVYDDAFYHALGDTLVVEDMQVARRLFGRYRMVTLDGSIVEKSGLMTGGSNAKSSLKFSQNEDEELATYKKRLEEFESKHKGLESSKSELEEKHEKIRKYYSDAMNELNKKKIEYDNIVRNKSDAQKNIEAKLEFIKEAEPKIEELGKNLDIFEEKHLAINELSAALTEQISKIEEEMPQDELSKLNELTEGIEFEIKKLETQIANCNNEIKGFNMEIEFHNESIKSQEERIVKGNLDNVKLVEDKEKYAAEIEQIQAQITELDIKIKEIGEKLGELQSKRDELQKSVIDIEKQKATLETKIERTTEQLEAYKARRKELEPELVAIREELQQNGFDLAELKPTEISIDEVMRKISSLDRRMEELGAVNMRAIQDYDEVGARKAELEDRLKTLDDERKQINDRMLGYEDLKKKAFLETFNNINENFKDIFAQLSDGEGKLILENPENPLAGGMTIEARPRDKKMQRLESMSGGEKSLTALAFVFAIQRYMPAPFYAFDEVDMHLDGINVEKLSDMIKKQAAHTQFIVVSLRKPMIESANRTIGVTQKEKGITKVTGVRLSD